MTNDIIPQDRQERESVSRGNPCPVCEKTDWCWIATDKSSVWCMRHASGGLTREFKDGHIGHLHILSNGNSPATYIHPGYLKKPAPKPVIDWKPQADQYVAHSIDQVSKLAIALGVTVESLQALAVGYGRPSAKGSDCWMWPERDATGKIVGIKRRLKSGKKFFIKGGSPGLYFVDNWQHAQAPVLLVEGGSDTAAGITLGMSVIGRPSNTGGVPHLAELLKGTDRDIIVIGEHDEKENGTCPGRDGAISTAQRLADLLDRPISWAMPADGEKDTRTWLNSQNIDLTDQETLAAAGKYFLAEVTADATIIHPGPKPHVETYQEPAGEIVRLDDWRQQMSESRLATIGMPGIYFDGSPTGAGKSHADRVALELAGQSLTLLPTHANCRELADELKQNGIEAIAYPQLTEDNCANYQEATAARNAGLSIPAAVCIGCNYREKCEYQAEAKIASKADHSIATHHRAAKGFTKLAKGKHFVSVHENAEDLLRPTVSFPIDSLGNIEQAFYEARQNEIDKKGDQGIDLELIDFLEKGRTAIEIIRQHHDDATKTISKPIEHRQEKPNWLEKKLWRAIKRVTQTTDGDVTMPISGNALRMIVGLVTGELHEWAIQVDHPTGPGGKATTEKSVLGIWQTELPKHSPVWLADATGSADRITRLSGRDVDDCTPEGRLEMKVEPLQVPHDITGSSSSPLHRERSTRRAAAYLRGVLVAHPDRTQIGVIGHQNHIDDLFAKDSDLLSDEAKARIRKFCYFREGPDVASNEWQQGDLLTILGTPRVPPSAVRRHLLRYGMAEAARRDVEWDKQKKWEGRTESGEMVVITGAGYRDPDWHQAYCEIVRDRIHQAVGRGRGILETGVPVIILSNENLGYLLADPEQVEKLAKPVQEAYEALCHCCANAKDTIVAKAQQRHPVSTSQIAAELGKSPGHTTRLLSQAESAGLVDRQPGRKGGWLAADHSEPQIEVVPAIADIQIEPVSTIVDIHASPAWSPEDLAELEVERLAIVQESWSEADIAEWEEERLAMAEQDDEHGDLADITPELAAANEEARRVWDPEPPEPAWHPIDKSNVTTALAEIVASSSELVALNPG